MEETRVQRPSAIRQNALLALALFGFASSSWAAEYKVESKELEVEEGQSVTLSFVPEPNFRVSDVRIDGQSVGAVPSYRLPAASRDMTVDVSFVALVDSLTPIVGTPKSQTIWVSWLA